MKYFIILTVFFCWCFSASAKTKLNSNSVNPTFVNTQTDFLESDYCEYFTSSRELFEMCEFTDSIENDRIEMCYLLTSSYVAQALCLVNGQSNRRVSNCYFTTQTHLDEQDCLSPVRGLSLGYRLGLSDKNLEIFGQ